ncbi:hypothetical protein MHC_01700 [Mycoplasma haemocanis str. Illinois]|uniref:Uncharacterized protein n=1 Tax=Mycoplasma haemocanis (strain Illinois) TaxID=1111676 RepID=H6N6D4_MYCHN|nr:hypothetical protein [Mycoplasma haemocanis]AEW45206.1 hypothetical protein MHC_01700 [Mycoplasma haemocanis str. Illinois]
MPNLPIIGSIVVLGGAASVGGVAMELSKPKGRNISLAKNKKPSPFKMPARCELFHIQSSEQHTVKKVAESELSEKIKNQDSGLWEKIDKDCNIKWKIYVAYRSYKWVYNEDEQGKPWKLETASDRSK